MLIVDIIPWLLASGVLLSVLSIVLQSWRNGISPMPASGVVRQAVAGEVSRISGYANIVEAGSGWGTLGLEVIRRCPGKRLTGIENSSIPLWASRLLAGIAVRMLPASGAGEQLHGRLRYVRGDMYRSSYEHADIVLCYLFPGAMARLADKFRQELPPGAVVISVCFALPGKQAVRTITCGDALRTKVYVYSY
ncbi:class I SAM-dependent methyltransferase [Paenibacillus sp. HW567]|uniref:class I SAM-dependent methyltransferase n=1 Tax=Paenibacillus sp. HW567 TaxID=1034769 RepID=UPI000380589D|nr:class I SAM-dependent methyltransferase [Paenibacillus sp. HW567]